MSEVTADMAGVTTWTVFKNHGIGGTVAGWVEVGTYDSTSPYWLGGGVAQTLGEENAGAGEYLLLSDERYKRITVVERTVYEEAKDEDTAEATMAREG